jgi:hypothetical protein
MAKPTRIKHSAAGIYLNDIQIDRGTSFGCSTALNTEELKELGNIGIVEIIDGIPTVDITLDANEYGSIKTLAALANKGFDCGWTQAYASSGLHVSVCSGDFFIDERRYTLAADADVDLTTAVGALTAGQRQISVVSISTASAVSHTEGTATTGTPVAPTTPAGELKLAELYLMSGMATITDDYILNVHDLVTIEVTDYEYAKADIVVPVKEAGDNTTADFITRSCYVEDAFCNRIDMTFNTGGVSTCTFGMESDNKRWFLGTKRNIVVDRQARTGAPYKYTLAQAPTSLDNTLYTLRCRVYQPTTDTYVYKEEGTSDEVTAGTKDYWVSGGTTAVFSAAGNPAAGEVLVFRYCSDRDDSVNFLRLPLDKNAHPDPPGGLMQGQIELYLADDASNHVLRVESCSISASLTREALNELGHKLPYDRPLTLPVPVTVTLNTTASNLEEFARLCGKKTEWDSYYGGTDAALTELSIEDFSKSLGLVIKMYRESDVKRVEIPHMWEPWLKQITIEDLSVSDESFDLRLDANATQTFGMKADNLKIEGRI